MVAIPADEGLRDVDLYDALRWLKANGQPYEVAVVERYPRWNHAEWRWTNDSGDVFAYQFLSPAGRNTAMYITATRTLMTLPGMDGLGRVYGFPIKERRNFDVWEE